MTANPGPDTPDPRTDGDDDGEKSWVHQVTVGSALIVVSLFFFPEGIGALGGDSGNFMFRADDGEPDIFFGGALIVLGAIMVIGGIFLVIKGLRKRKAEAGGFR